MIYGAMLAGGVGSRMKSAVIPKQFLEVEGKPIIIYTLQNMLKVDRFDYIYIATHKDYLAYMKEMVQKYTDKPEKVRIIEGGKERMDSIHNVTDAILKDEGVHEDDVIVIHDAVRPLVTEKILNDSIDAAGTYGACVCGLPAVDTMLYSEDGKVVTTIPELSLIHISEPTRRTPISYAVFCLKKKKTLIHNSEPTRRTPISYALFCLQKQTQHRRV